MYVIKSCCLHGVISGLPNMYVQTCRGLDVKFAKYYLDIHSLIVDMGPALLRKLFYANYFLSDILVLIVGFWPITLKFVPN